MYVHFLFRLFLLIRTRSRMEEINEIIARSETRAQQLLATGTFSDDPFKTLSPSRDFLSTLPANLGLLRSFSPTEGHHGSLSATLPTMNGSYENKH